MSMRSFSSRPCGLYCGAPMQISIANRWEMHVLRDKAGVISCGKLLGNAGWCKEKCSLQDYFFRIFSIYSLHPCSKRKKLQLLSVNFCFRFVITISYILFAFF